MVDGMSERRHSKRYLRRFLREMVELVGMRVIKGPKVQVYKGDLQGWVILAESHSSIHVEGFEIHVDLFSCQRYETQGPMEFIIQRIKLTNVSWQAVERPMPEPIRREQ